MKIAFMNNGKSYLPEIQAYTKYINDYSSWSAEEIVLGKDNGKSLNNYDVIWRFTGIDYKKKSNDQLVIHEYNSLSAGKFNRQKDMLKKAINVTPDGRIFLNEHVKNNFNFNDEIPDLKRDMGIASNFFYENTIKEYDFVYLGSMEASREVENILSFFRKGLINKSIILIGDPPDYLYKEFRGYKNITFTGKVPYKDVPILASSAIYGINYIPDVFPYNIQTSTKLLEYCALGLKIITNDYKWVNDFEKNRGANFYKLSRDLSNFSDNQLEKFHFNTPDVRDLEWNKMFNDIELMKFLDYLAK